MNCPDCGKEIDRLKDNICDVCFEKRKQEIREIKYRW